MNRYRKRDSTPFIMLAQDDPARRIGMQAGWLVGIFFGLCILFWILVVIADSQHPGGISIYVWGRVITESILSVAYFLFYFLWQRGKFWGYLRMLMTSALAFVSTISVVVLAGEYPWWLRLEQAVQALVVAVLFYKLTRPAIRRLFVKK